MKEIFVTTEESYFISFINPTFKMKQKEGASCQILVYILKNTYNGTVHETFCSNSTIKRLNC